jgi:hypothetical protein
MRFAPLTLAPPLPRLSHRLELLHASLPENSPATALAKILTRR